MILERFLTMLEEGDENKRKSILLPCRTAEEQEAKRVMLYHKRRALLRQQADMIGIRKTVVDGNLYVEVYCKEEYVDDLIILDRSTGTIERIKVESPSKIAERTRIANLMRRDGYSEEEIEAVLRDAEKGEEKVDNGKNSEG